MVQVREELKPKVEAESVGKCCFFVCFAYHVCLAFSHNPEPQTQGMWLSTMGCAFPYQSINNTISHRRACQSNPGNPSSEIPFSVDSRLYQVDSLKLTGTTLKVNLFSDNNREKNTGFTQVVLASVCGIGQPGIHKKSDFCLFTEQIIIE